LFNLTILLSYFNIYLYSFNHHNKTVLNDIKLYIYTKLQSKMMYTNFFSDAFFHSMQYFVIHRCIMGYMWCCFHLAKTRYLI